MEAIITLSREIESIVPVAVGALAVPETTPDGCELGRTTADPVGRDDVLEGDAECLLEAEDSVGYATEAVEVREAVLVLIVLYLCPLAEGFGMRLLSLVYIRKGFRQWCLW